MNDQRLDVGARQELFALMDGPITAEVGRVLG